MNGLINDPACVCTCHVNPATWVPVCPSHAVPLVAAEAGLGLCLWVGLRVKVRTVEGHDVRQRQRCTAWSPQSWVWVPRDRFNASDLPPLNGHEPPRVPRLAEGAWSVCESHPCVACGTRTRHVVGENRAVCTVCGHHEWVPSPQHTEV